MRNKMLAKVFNDILELKKTIRQNHFFLEKEQSALKLFLEL